MAAAGAGASGGRAELVRARLAAEERAALEAIKGDLRRWLARREILQLEIAPVSFLDTLDSGEHLCRLAGMIQEAARRWEAEKRDPPVRVPSKKLCCKPIKAARGSPMFLASARDNTAQFISWCRELGVEEAVLFESVGLVEHSDERRIVLCLLDVARYAEKVGISPPELVALEREIEEMETLQDREGEREGGGGGQREITEEEEEDSEKDEAQREREEEEEKEYSKSEEPSAKRVKRESPTTSVTPPTNQPTRHKRSRRRKKQKSSDKKDTVDKKVMQCVSECTCEHTIEVENFGKGKFTVSHSKAKAVTIYARLLSDRVMIRVGGGWETLEHFLLKHDPCRAEHITESKSQVTSKNPRKRAREM